jgi:regulator of RNase E activity RraA
VPTIAPETLAILRRHDTPTICNALEHVMGGRTAEGFTKTPVVCADVGLPPIVGLARTARIRASSPAQKLAAEVRALRMQYYEYVSAGEGPNVVVIEDTDWPHCIGGFWGEMQVAQHKGLGVAGTLTNGVLRDLGMLDPGYQVIAGSVGPSHAFVHVTELDVPVTVFGMAVHPGDLIHADRHGGVVIPAAHTEKMPGAIDIVMRKEVPILKAARAPGFTVEKLKAAWLEADAIK